MKFRGISRNFVTFVIRNFAYKIILFLFLKDAAQTIFSTRSRETCGGQETVHPWINIGFLTLSYSLRNQKQTKYTNFVSATFPNILSQTITSCELELLQTLSRPLQSISRPKQALSRPLQAHSRPLQTISPPLYSFLQPLKALLQPASKSTLTTSTVNLMASSCSFLAPRNTFKTSI
jgi:hypothetical protein